MRVVYKPYVLKALMQAINKASFEDRELEKIVLTRKEWDQFREEYDQPIVGSSVMTFYGVKLEVQG